MPRVSVSSTILYGDHNNVYLGDVLNDDDLEFIPVRFESLAQVGRLALRADRTPDREALLEKSFDDPHGDKAVRASHEDFARGDCGHTV